MSAPLCDIDFYGPDCIANPIPAYHKMLKLGPVCYLRANKIYAICHYDALLQAMRRSDVFISGEGVSIDPEVNPKLKGNTLNSDGARHKTGRAITAAPLTPKGLQAVRAQIETTAEQIAEEFVARRAFDAASELAPELPLRVVRDLVGLSDSAKDKMLTWAAATFDLIGDARDRRAQAISDLGEMRNFMETHGKPDRLSDGGWAQRIFVEGKKAGLSQDHCAELMRDYINPSLDTTISAISYGVMLFAKNPDQWDALRRDLGLMRSAVEEIIRLATPIKAFTRYVAADTELAGVTFQRGQRILLIWGAANRDPSKFADPDRFDIMRNPRGHVGFGHGVHSCMGMHLARLELSSLFGALAHRVARFEITGEATRTVNASIHAYKSLPVALESLS